MKSSQYGGFRKNTRSTRLSFFYALLALIGFASLLAAAAYYVTQSSPPAEQSTDLASSAAPQFLFNDLETLPAPVAVPLDYAWGDLNKLDSGQLEKERKKRMAMLLGTFISPEYALRSSPNSETSTQSKWTGLYSMLAGGTRSLCGSGASYDWFIMMNPLLLVEAKFWGLTSWNKNFRWRQGVVSPESIAAQDFPAFPRPASIEFNPQFMQFTYTYNISDFLQRLSPWVELVPETKDITFALSSFNAHDLGFDTLLVDGASSTGVQMDASFSAAIQLTSAITAGSINDSAVQCTYINTPDSSRQLLQLITLPAELHLKLWTQSSVTMPPQSTVTVVLKFV